MRMKMVTESQTLKDAAKEFLAYKKAQKFRCGQMVSWATLETICDLLNCQPGDIIEFVKTEE